MDLLKSLPLGLYLEQPITWLHQLDARVKIAWLMSFLLAPILGNPLWRIALVILLIIMTLAAKIPLRVWKQQMGLLLILCGLILCLTAITPDGLSADHQARLPLDDLTFNSKLVSDNPSSKYSYVLFNQGPIKITRKSVDLAINVSSLLFTLVYSTNLYLLTTSPEEITAGLEDLMSPLNKFNIPVTEIALTLTLSLRFIPLVLEEVQNLIRSVFTRAINWEKLGWKNSTKVWLIVVERLFENLLLRAEQIASAMTVRGFTTPNTHQVQWHYLKFRSLDWIALGCLVLFWIMRIIYGGLGTWKL